MDTAFMKGLLFVAAGALNPFTSLHLDKLNGQFSLRPESVSMALLANGAVDTFRHWHRSLQAYTYVHSNGTASRIDSIWCSTPQEMICNILNAAIVNDPRHIRDHFIPLVDVAFSIPSVERPTNTGPLEWMHLLSFMSEE